MSEAASSRRKKANAAIGGASIGHAARKILTIEPAGIGSALDDHSPLRRSEARDDNDPRPREQKYQPPRFVSDSRMTLAALDLLFISSALTGFFFAVHGRMDFSVSRQAPFVVPVAVVANMIFLYASGGYRRDTLVNRAFAISRLPVAIGFGGAALFVALHYGLATIFPADTLYRSIGRSSIIVLICVGISLCATMAGRVVFYAMVRQRWFQRRILVLGAGKRAQYLHEMMSHSSHKLASDLIFVPSSIIGGPSENPLIASSDAVLSVENEPIDVVARKLSVDEIIVALDDRRGISLNRLLTCKAHGIPVTDLQSFIERETGRVDLSSLDLSWLLYSDSFRMRLIDVGVKRLLDVSVSLILLFISIPVLLVAMAAIALEGHGQIFFKQKRVTQNGRTFWLYKLRTMFADAEAKGPRWADANDPRITRVGRILRRTRIDEIPQLLNVLRGDMSLVGPRPERPVFVEQLSQEIQLYDLRHTVKAGLTGWAQINYHYGSSSADAKRKLEYDLHYVKNYQLFMDVSIIVQTLRVLLWPDGVR